MCLCSVEGCLHSVEGCLCKCCGSFTVLRGAYVSVVVPSQC